MGTPIAPTIANIFMSNLEEELLLNSPVKPSFYKRYIDDIIFIWEDTLENLNTFMDRMNNQHPSIKYTFNISETSVNFLDLVIFKNPDFHQTLKFSTKTFFKPTATFQYTHNKSHHPFQTKRSIIKSECLRYLRQCSNEQDFLSLKDKLIFNFKKRGYSIKTIKNAIKNITFNKKKTLTTIKPQNSKPIIPFIIHFDQRRSRPKNILLKHWESLSRDPELYSLYKRRPIMCYKNYNNLGQLMTRSALTQDHQNVHGTICTDNFGIPNLINPCHKRGCICCFNLYRKNTFKSNTTNNTYFIRNHFTCDSRNLIYIIQCKFCNKQYVGQTTTPLRTRIRHHRNKFNNNNINTPRWTIYQHFDKHKSFDFFLIPIQSCKPEQLNDSEQYWINELLTLQPHGLNGIYA